MIDLDALFGDAIHACGNACSTATIPAGAWRCSNWPSRACATAGIRTTRCVGLRRLEETHGGIDVAGLARELGFSRRHLAQLFQREAGLSPKALARVLRFSHTLDCVRGAATPRWDRVALDCGYYDQSHMIRDFQAFSGHAPRDFLRRPAFDDETISEAPPSVQ